MGDAICAALGAGFYADLFTAGEAMVEVGEGLEPNPATRATYDELFGVYRAAYGALKPFFEPLARARRLTP
jgi:xylulokinase